MSPVPHLLAATGVCCSCTALNNVSTPPSAAYVCYTHLCQADGANVGGCGSEAPGDQDHQRHCLAQVLQLALSARPVIWLMTGLGPSSHTRQFTRHYS